MSPRHVNWAGKALSLEVRRRRALVAPKPRIPGVAPRWHRARTEVGLPSEQISRLTAQAAHGAFRLWEFRDLGCDARVARRCTTRVIDDVADLAVIAQANRDHAVEPDVRAVGNFDGPAQHHAAIPEDAVDSEPPGFVASHILRHFVRSPSIRSRRACVARLVRRIVGNLGLVEVYAPTVTVPEDLEFLLMLDEQAVDGDIVSIHNQPVRSGIALPAH